MLAPAHDPGGKVATPLPEGMLGDAEFYGPRGERRLWLRRSWIKPGEQRRTIMFTGMNPSTASHEVNDPTVTREVNFSMAWGFNDYIKTNVMDFRATYPKDLLAPGVIPCSERNLKTILHYARYAEKIVLCYGAPKHKSLERYGKDVTQALLDAGHFEKMFCFGLTKNGFPVHPLYLPKTATLVPFQ